MGQESRRPHFGALAGQFVPPFRNLPQVPSTDAHLEAGSSLNLMGFMNLAPNP